ncbi:hypothetical protein IC798_01175 [Acinetobacter seifertii]|uniref:NACHT domain-containing protein n=1 Tax=Acinetobacter seifertii TaxID=1530123 RepID=UPI00168CAD2B|nr:hypothetical protein [Acinetobacter seifertii]QNX02069.1 hypothetical protein IC798_01175 [Acinetobacter seifertii]
MSISKLMQVKTLYTGSDKSVNLFDFFQQPKLEYDDEIYIIENIEQVKIENNNNIVFMGTVGQGKSILMKYLALHDLIDNNRIPVFIELKNISSNKNIKSLIKEFLGPWIGYDDQILELVLKSGKISLFLDAFDEIDTDLVQEAFHDISLLSQNYNNLKISISSRPQTIITKSPLFDNIHLQPYEKEEQEGLINKLVNDKENVRILVESINKSSHEVKAVLTTPLMVVLFINQYNVGFSVPQHVTDFYKNIFDVVTFTHDRSKGIEKRKSFSSLNQDQLEKIFERFCFETFLKIKTVFDRKTLIELLKISLEKNNINNFNDYYNLISDYTRFACLILQDGSSYTFIHKSIQEFYVSKFIESLPEKLAKNVIGKKFLHKHVGVENYLNFLKILKPYYYTKYYILESIKVYEEFFGLNFIDNEENYKKFINSICIIDNMEEEGKYSRIVYIDTANTAFVNFFDMELFEIIYRLEEVNFVDDSVIQWGGAGNNNFKRDIVVTNFLIEDEIAKLAWNNICLKVNNWREEVIRIESSVLDEDLEL